MENPLAICSIRLETSHPQAPTATTTNSACSPPRQCTLQAAFHCCCRIDVVCIKLLGQLVPRQTNEFFSLLWFRSCRDQFWILFLQCQKRIVHIRLLYFTIYCSVNCCSFFSSECFTLPFLKHEFHGFSGWRFSV